MNILLATIILSSFINAQTVNTNTGNNNSATTNTVPGTYPPVQKKYWVPTNNMINHRLDAQKEDSGNDNQNSSRKPSREQRNENAQQNKFDVVTESGIVKWMGNHSVHVVKKGETLWDISRKYFQDPWYWPRLWSWNSHITNPHWLFPGTKVWLEKGNKAVVRVQKHEKVNFFGLKYNSVSIYKRKSAFVKKEIIDKALKIKGAETEKTLLSLGDLVYFNLEKEKMNPEKGSVYTIFRPEKNVKLPGSKKKLGSVAKVLGQVKILEIRPNKVAKGRIINSTGIVKRGDNIGKLKEKFRKLKPYYLKVEKPVVGKIFYSLTDREMLVPDNIVLVNIGSEKGLKKGALLRVVQRGDGLAQHLHPIDSKKEKEPSGYPWENIGILVVLHVEKNYCLAMIEQNKKPIKKGQVVVFGDNPDDKKYNNSKNGKK
ncbi:MAG: LysM domain-containing protein [Deltaproteobacteria bacterium]|nr:LysM domain-containing protein [Deltaproteobacteria bacterium]